MVVVGSGNVGTEESGTPAIRALRRPWSRPGPHSLRAATGSA